MWLGAPELDRAGLETCCFSCRSYSRSLLSAIVSPPHPHPRVISVPPLVSTTIAELRALSYFQTLPFPLLIQVPQPSDSVWLTQNSASVPHFCPAPPPSPDFPVSLWSGHHHPPYPPKTDTEETPSPPPLSPTVMPQFCQFKALRCL